MYRPASPPFSGRAKIVFAWRGWTAIGKPNSDGSPAVISCQVAPPSALR